MASPPPYASCTLKQQRIKQLFASCHTQQQKYEKIIALGQQLPAFPAELKTPERRVKGCQSQMYLSTSYSEGKVIFQAYSEALISAGLAALLLSVYSDESPEAILTCPPLFLEELGIHDSLSPGRSNGLSSLFLRMKQEVIKFLIPSAS